MKALLFGLRLDLASVVYDFACINFKGHSRGWNFFVEIARIIRPEYYKGEHVRLN